MNWEFHMSSFHSLREGQGLTFQTHYLVICHMSRHMDAGPDGPSGRCLSSGA
jgi:hypothetical protein